MAKVSRTDPGGDDVMEIHEISGLMTRVRMEHKLESLRRDQEKLESAIGQIHLKAENTGQPVHKPLVEQKKKAVAKITEEMESIIRSLEALNEGINPEKDPE